jgi:hypothetical protein
LNLSRTFSSSLEAVLAAWIVERSISSTSSSVAKWQTRQTRWLLLLGSLQVALRPTAAGLIEMLPMYAYVLMLAPSCAKPLLKLYSFWFVSQYFYPHSSIIKFTQSLEGFCWGFYFYVKMIQNAYRTKMN